MLSVIIWHSGIFSNYFDLQSVLFILEFVLTNELFPSHQVTFDFAQVNFFFLKR